MIQTFTKLARRYPIGLALFCAVGLVALTPTLVSASSTGARLSGAQTIQNTPTALNIAAIILVELGTIFWVAGQLWANFVLQPCVEKHPEERSLNEQIEQRFERRYSLPTLVLLLIANLGLLFGRLQTANGGNSGSVFSTSLLSEELTGGRAGMYWLVSMGVTLLALLIGLYMVFSKKRPAFINQALPLVNLFLGVVLLIAITMSGDAPAVNAILVPYAVIVDWLHLLAASLWVGGMIYIFVIYLPVLKSVSLPERTRSLLAVLAQFTPLAVIGVGLLATTGPLDTSFHLTSANQFFTTAYGRALLVKSALTLALLIISAYHTFSLRPRLKKEYAKYTYVRERLESLQQSEAGGELEETEKPDQSSQLAAIKQMTQRVKRREERLAKGNTLLTRLLSYEPALGVAIIICASLMTVFGATLTATNSAPTPTAPVSSVFHSTAKTSDGKYNVTLTVSPNRFGTNIFTVEASDAHTGSQLNTTGVSVTIYTTMLDMNMGTDSVILQANGKESFSASGNLPMSGHWGLEVQLRTPDQQNHEVNFTISTPF